MPDAPLRVFISYARTDSAFVDRLEQDLKAHQFHPWVDRKRLEAGDDWLDIIQDAIDNCQALVVVVSPAAVQSKYVRLEYRYAADMGKSVIPAMHHQPTRIPIDLRRLHRADFEFDYEEGLRQLLQALNRLKPPAAPPPAPAAPSKTKEQWLNQGKAHYHAGRYDEALAAYNHAVQLDSKYGLTLELDDIFAPANAPEMALFAEALALLAPSKEFPKLWYRVWERNSNPAKLSWQARKPLVLQWSQIANLFAGHDLSPWVAVTPTDLADLLAQPLPLDWKLSALTPLLPQLPPKQRPRLTFTWGELNTLVTQTAPSGKLPTIWRDEAIRGVILDQKAAVSPEEANIIASHYPVVDTVLVDLFRDQPTRPQALHFFQQLVAAEYHYKMLLLMVFLEECGLAGKENSSLAEQMIDLARLSTKQQAAFYFRYLPLMRDTRKVASLAFISWLERYLVNLLPEAKPTFLQRMGDIFGR